MIYTFLQVAIIKCGNKGNIIYCKRCVRKEIALLQTLVCGLACGVCNCAVCGWGFNSVLTPLKSGARRKQNKFQSNFHYLYSGNLVSLVLFSLVANGLAMVRGAFCGTLSCPLRDRKQHENRDVYLHDHSAMHYEPLLN